MLCTVICIDNGSTWQSCVKYYTDTGHLSVSRSSIVIARGSQGWRNSKFWTQSLTNGICTNTSINWDSKILTVAYRSSVELFLETIPYYIHQVWKEKPKDLLLGYYSGCHSRIVSSSGDVSVDQVLRFRKNHAILSFFFSAFFLWLKIWTHSNCSSVMPYCILLCFSP